MAYLILGLALWAGAHLFKRVLPEQRAALGKAGRPVVAVLILAAVALMIAGYRSTEDVYLYALPTWAWYLNNLLMLLALFLMDIGRVRRPARTLRSSVTAQTRTAMALWMRRSQSLVMAVSTIATSAQALASWSVMIQALG